MDSIEELLLLFGGLLILAVALFYILPASSSIGNEFRGQAISQIILNSFDLMTPIITPQSNTIIIYDSGFPTSLYIEVKEYNASSNQLVQTFQQKESFHVGKNYISLPSNFPGNAYYEIDLYDPSKTILYTTYYVYRYVNDFVEINNINGNFKLFINNKQVYPSVINNTVFLSLPNGLYNITIYTPFYYFSKVINFPVSSPVVINIPTSGQYNTYTAYVYQMLPKGVLNPLAGAVININDGTAIYKTNSSGSVHIQYTINSPVLVNVSCPPTTCGTAITNNYTSLQGIYSSSNFSQSTPFILYPKFRTIANLYITCNGTSYPTPGTISIIASPQNTTRDKYGTVNASGKFISYLYAGIYNVSAISLSGLFNSTQINVTHYNQTFNLTFNYCIVHIPYNETIFYETGLPANTLWSVTYGGAVNQSTTNKIIFTEINTKVNYTYSIPNVTVNGVKYIPSPSSGASYTGKQINVKFTS